MNKKLVFWSWTVFCVVAGGLFGWFTWTHLLAEMRAPYSVTVALDNEFEGKVMTSHPGTKLIRLPTNIQFSGGKWNDKSQSYDTPFMDLSSKPFLEKLGEGDTVFVHLNRPKSNVRSNHDGVERFYVLAPQDGDYKFQQFPAYREFTPRPAGTHEIDSVSHTALVFAKKSGFSGHAGDIISFGNGIGTFIVWAFFSMLIYKPRRKEEAPESDEPEGS